VDGDKGINNKVTYSITKGPRDLFDIDATSGLVFTRAQLDREAEENSDGTFILEITVRELSKIKPQPSVSTEVTIILTDVNDETPMFRSSVYHAEINENAPQNTPVNFMGDAVPEVFDHDLVSHDLPGACMIDEDLGGKDLRNADAEDIFCKRVNLPGLQRHVSDIYPRRWWDVRRDAIPWNK